MWLSNNTFSVTSGSSSTSATGENWWEAYHWLVTARVYTAQKCRPSVLPSLGGPEAFIPHCHGALTCAGNRGSSGPSPSPLRLGKIFPSIVLCFLDEKRNCTTDLFKTGRQRVRGNARRARAVRLGRALPSEWRNLPEPHAAKAQFGRKPQHNRISKGTVLNAHTEGSCPLGAGNPPAKWPSAPTELLRISRPGTNCSYLYWKEESKGVGA